MAIQPLVSVVTPFYNTSAYLAQCIESVLQQSFSNFEYILMDNCSTDGSREIAETYARRDPRIRLIQCSQFLAQIPNYNRALATISDCSRYCKIVQADDSIFPQCLELMIKAFEQSESIGLVSSYWLMNDKLHGSGYPYPITVIPGKEWAARHVRGVAHVFGSQTQVMYRSSLIRQQKPFYNEATLHPDTEKCLDILEHWDFAFVHQVLSFSRTGNERSISAAVYDLQPGAVDRYITEQRHASVFLSVEEATSLKKRSKLRYYRALARGALLRGGGGSAYWGYHKAALKTLGETLDRHYLVLIMSRELLWLALNPGMTTVQALRHLRHGRKMWRSCHKIARRIWTLASTRPSPLKTTPWSRHRPHGTGALFGEPGTRQEGAPVQASGRQRAEN